jgi:hypothetical protein
MTFGTTLVNIFYRTWGFYSVLIYMQYINLAIRRDILLYIVITTCTFVISVQASCLGLVQLGLHVTYCDARPESQNIGVEIYDCS